MFLRRGDEHFDAASELRPSLLREPEFLRDLVNEQLNSIEAPAEWNHCTVIPI